MTDKDESALSPEMQRKARAGHGYPVPLTKPIQREGKVFECLELRLLAPGDLRGVSRKRLVRMEVDDVLKVLPRISSPVLRRQELRTLDPADLMQCAIYIAECVPETNKASGRWHA